MATPKDVRKFWFEDSEPSQWYVLDEAYDQKIRERFLDTWERISSGRGDEWWDSPEDMLAHIILTDQFPRNMFRGEGRSFASDRMALRTAQIAVSLDADLRIEEPARQFFYLPMMHSESLTDQERSVRMFMLRMPNTGETNLLHARAHRQVIRDFGRFPYRNDALGRATTDRERAYLDAGGYSFTVESLEKADAA